MTENNKFFSNQNIKRAIWALIVGIIGFLSGQAYQKVFGPQKVIIDAQSTKAQPIYVKIHERDEQRIPTDINKKLTGLKEDIDRIKIYSSYLSDDNKSINKKWPSVYALPLNVKGYIISSILGISEANCVESKLHSGNPIIISFMLRDKNIISKATPLIIEIIKPLSKNEVQQIYSGTYELRHGKNNLVIDIPLENGIYELRYGYYLLSELNKEYPSFYTKQCRFSVSR